MGPSDSWVSNPDESHGPLMSVVTWSLVSVAAAFLIPRLCIRQRQGKLWLDDCTLVVSWILLLVQVSINQASINLGYGRHTFDLPATIIPWVQCKPLAKTFVDFIPGECINKHPSVVYGRFQAGEQTAPKEDRCMCRHESGYTVTTDESYKSIIWAVAECSMAIVATSIPVLRVVFKHALNSAIEGYTSSSRSKSRSKSRSYPSYAVSLKNQMSTRQSSKKTPEITVSGECGESLEEVFRHGSNGSQNYLELGDLAVDEQTGRITASFPESVSDHAERHVPNYSV
ncbi:hypothetical protein COCHEDRAFT_1091013 [Bipolaris maydis C5]|uniref:Integral membrane protein n=1 Tax=Cochliobolus heterostrophus (strain C5 / ATCC 48332 / race O) TaxID=701091 RepID=M2TC53_COCH5|nr:hypothetical protein COCHEDRAFT_1091013 [Bipolaris maydis C5]